MKKSHLLILALVLVVVLAGWNTKKTETPFGPRGKVIADGGAELLKLDINRAAFFNFQNNDSTVAIEGSLCVLDAEGKITDQSYRIVPRRFPAKNFNFGCNDAGTQVDFMLVTQGNGVQLAIVKFIKRN